VSASSSSPFASSLASFSYSLYSKNCLPANSFVTSAYFQLLRHFQKPLACIHQRRRVCSESVSAWTAHLLRCQSIRPLFETTPVNLASPDVCRNWSTDSTALRSDPNSGVHGFFFGIFAKLLAWSIWKRAGRQSANK
jgi:hypothetical protein